MRYPLKQRRTSRMPNMALGLVLALLITACGSGDTAESSDASGGAATPAVTSGTGTTEDGDVSSSEDRVAKAAEVGEVVFAGYMSEPFAEALREAWSEEYPDIELGIIQGRVGEIQERVQTELRTGNVQTDVVSSGGHWLEVFKGADMLQPSTLPDSVQLTVPSDPENMWHPLGFFGYGMAINTEILSESERPEAWADLTDDRWKDQLLMDDPQSGSTGFGWTVELLNEPAFGEDYIRDVAANEPAFVAGTTQPFGQLARGEYSVYFPALPGETESAAESGAPLEWVLPTEGVYETRINVGMVRDAPNPEGAALLIEFLLDPEILALRNEIDQLFPAVEIPGVDVPPLVTETDFEVRIRETARAEEINREYWGR